LKTPLLSNKNIHHPDSKQISSSNKRKPIPNTRQQEVNATKQDFRIIHTRKKKLFIAVKKKGTDIRLIIKF
jgi:hypothetical protein